jgi:hypothetical protein
MIGVAIGIAVGESRSNLSQVVGADRLGAQRARSLPAGRPAIHQDESHLLSLSLRDLKRPTHFFEQSAVRQE